MKQMSLIATSAIAVIVLSTLASIAFSCKREIKILTEKEFPSPPKAERIPQTFSEFGKSRTDDFFWMKDKNNPEVIKYIEAENSYSDMVMKSTKDLQEIIYNEIVGMIKEDDQTYPVLHNGYYYYNRSEKGKQYKTYLRKENKEGAAENIMFDCNKMAEGKNAFIFMGSRVSPDNNLAAYVYNETGSYADFTLRIRNLANGKDLDIKRDSIASIVWANDSKTIFYTVVDNALRSYRVYRKNIDNKGAEQLIYEEKDPKFTVGIDKSSSDKMIFISSNSSTTSEVQYLYADVPLSEFKTFLPREKDIQYSIEHHDNDFIIRYQDLEDINGKLYISPISDHSKKSSWKEIVPHNTNVRIDGFDVFKDYVVLELRENGLTSLEVMDLHNFAKKKITFPEPVYTVSLDGNPEYDATTFRYNYTSLNRPSTLYEYDILKEESIKLKEQEIPSGFNPDNYVVERLWAKAADGVDIPMAIVYKKGIAKDGSNPALLYAYGSYGVTTDAEFSRSYYSLINRGFVVGIAQIRGGSDLGEKWYLDGKLLHKKNTFTDFIACSEKLIADKYTSANKLAAMGGSAGGLLMGAISNMRPDLYHSIIAAVPFVDVISTMLDTSLPLTTQEYEEWGNPNEKEYYDYMLSYSPYDNVKAQTYPNMLITGGINDSQVGFQEPTKWVAKLREYKTGDNLILLKINMESGHGGATGRYDGIKEKAFEWAFLLNRVGINM